MFNYYIYGGQQVILPEQLTERDSTEIALPYGSDGKVVPIQRFRDVRKLYAAMTDGNVEYVLYGVENQSEIHYAMAVKSNLYDVLDYAGQVEEAARKHRKDRKKAQKREKAEEAASEKELNSGEFLSGFWKEDKLIAPALMADSEIEKFQTNLREVLLFIKYSKDKGKLKQILKSNEERFRQVERRAADVIETITNSRLKYDEKEMKVDVCQAIKEMREESEQIGEKRGALETAQKNARNFYKMGIDVEKVAEGVGYDLKTVKEWLGLPT